MSILVLSFSDVARDPRVSKISRTLADIAPVTIIGYEGGKTVPLVQMRSIPKPDINFAHKLAIAARQLPANIIPSIARLTYPRSGDVRAMNKAIGDLSPRLIYANDLDTLPLAAAIKARTGAKLIYDSHEYAIGEGADRLLWRLIFQSYRTALESYFIHQADAICTVSNGIAAALADIYQLPQMPSVVRNIPPYVQSAYHPPGETINVLYQGLFLSDRGLEMLIDSVADWHSDRKLIMRGYGRPTYEAQLKARAERVAPQRIHFPGPTTSDSLINAATGADIGVMPFDPAGLQQRYAMPNKLFEYMMAGLAVVSTPCVNIAEIIQQHGVGAVSSSAHAKSFAAAINSISRADLARYKQASLAAAHELNWENERKKVTALASRLYTA
jgi:glycogen synthase